jgi:hypothetical protein
MSLFAGQHSFYNIDATGNQVPCQKCHGDVKAELIANAGVNPLQSAGPHAKMTCEDCHRQEVGLSSGDDAFFTLVYENAAGDTARTLALTSQDYEAGNYPKNISADDNASQVMDAWVAAGGVNWSIYRAGSRPHGNSLLSNKTTGSTYTGLLQFTEATYVSTVTGGVPKDPSAASMYGGLALYQGDTRTPWNMTGIIPSLNNFTGLGSKAVNPGSTYHAASLVSCFECHGGSTPSNHESAVTASASGIVNCNGCHYGGSANRWRSFAAGGFGLTELATDNGSAEAHNAWVTTPGVSRFAAGTSGLAIPINNDACIACHTHVAVDINFAKGYKLEIDATSTDDGYAVSNAKVAGHVNISIYGNQNGDTFAVTNQAITWNSEVPMYINGTGTAHVINYVNAANDNNP